MNEEGDDILRRIIILASCLFLVFGGVVSVSAKTQDIVDLTEKERQYVSENGTIKMVVDPDWYPYEKINDEGRCEGISADLIALISQRTGLDFELIPTTSWDESMKIAKSGEADIISFLNKTDERSQWLLFTEPYFTDPNVFITREEHDYISNLARLTDETIVLPEGTSVEERLRKDYPDLQFIIVKSEEEAISYVERKQADMTLRSLTMAAYVIKNEGYFNLKIAGEIPSYTNQLRIGITKDNSILQGILNKGISSITEQEIQMIINNHISIKYIKGFDYKLFGIIFSIFSFVLISSFFWLRRIQRLNKHLKERQEELLSVSEKLTISEMQYRKIAEELKVKNSLLQVTASKDTLTGLPNRYSFNQRLVEEIERANRYGLELSLLLIDIDHFKRINDTYGHNAGDEVICKISETLQNNIRKVDMIARWGGEEFVVLLPEIGLRDAIGVAEKLRREAEFLLHLDKEIVTISIGVSSWIKNDTMESWFNRTDKAQYHAKQEGRNRVCVSEGLDFFYKEILTWDPLWESGNLVIDEQHKKLLLECNDLISLLLQSEIQSLILPKLEALLINIKTHFKEEEIILRQMNYGELSIHINCHHKLIQKAENLVKKSMDGNLLPSDVVRYIVGEVVTIHLIQEDTKFFHLFRPI